MRTIFYVIVIMCAGCTSTYIKTPEYEISRVSFLQRVAFTVTSNTNGLTINYGNDGGQNAAGAIAKGAASAIFK